MKYRSEQQPESTTRPSQLSFFNRQTGTNAVVQPKLTVGSANDAHEHEANKTADMVMRKTDVQRACAHCEQEKEQTAQRKETSAATGGFTAPPSVSRAISRGGSALDSNAKTFMESRFNRSFENVQVHTDGEASASARDISARAYTSGNHIVFGDGQYQPNTEGGRHLLAHELTHVVQQGGKKESIQRDTTIPEVKVKSGDLSQILPQAGWKKKDIMIVARDFLGEPMSGRTLLLEFKGTHSAPQAHGGEATGGTLILNDVWLKPEGTLRVIAVSNGTPLSVPMGNTFYKLSKGSLNMEIQQEKREMKVTATSSKEAAEKVGAKGTAGVDFKVFSLGGEVSGESTGTTGSSTSMEWTVVLPTNALTIKFVN